MKKSVLIKLLTSFLLFFITINSFAAIQPKKIWERWEMNDPISLVRVDHSKWQQFLTKFVKHKKNGINVVDYDRMNDADRKALNNYILSLSKIKITEYNRHEQFAFWVNLYNALVVRTVLEHYPTGSINDINISPGLFSEGPWSAELIKVENIALSLKDIEHRVLRPIWNEPRVHYVLNYASIGSPNLLATAFTGHNTERLLNQGARRYINSLRGVQVIEHKLVASKIYEWFVHDFGANEQDVIEHIQFFARPRLAKALQGISQIDKTVFNWHLNNARHRTA